jgi:hypothetical protein
MAVLASNYLTLIDKYKREGAGDTGQIIELLKQQNPILEDAVAMECNLGTIHRHKVRTGLPSVSWGMLYKGVAQSKSTVQSVDDTTGFVEGLSSVDTRLLQLSKNPGALRLGEANSYMESMSQEMASGLFYHDTASSPEKFKGLSARYATYANATFNQGSENQVVHAGGSGADNTSIWFVTWGDNYTHLLYPEGTKAGIQREDMGQQRILDAAGNPYYVKEEKFTWHIGVAVKDWRYNARIANIDVSDVSAGTVDLYKLMTQAYYRLQSRRVSGGRQVIYMNRYMMEALDNLATGVGASANAKLQLRREEIQGAEVLTWRGMPIRESDSILNTESLVPVAS